MSKRVVCHALGALLFALSIPARAQQPIKLPRIDSAEGPFQNIWPQRFTVKAWRLLCREFFKTLILDASKRFKIDHYRLSDYGAMNARGLPRQGI